MGILAAWNASMEDRSALAFASYLRAQSPRDPLLCSAASICFSTPMICISVCLLFFIETPFLRLLLQEIIESRSDVAPSGCRQGTKNGRRQCRNRLRSASNSVYSARRNSFMSGGKDSNRRRVDARRAS